MDNLEYREYPAGNLAPLVYVRNRVQNQDCIIIIGDQVEGIDPNKIAYRGQPITSLTREQLIGAFVELASLIHKCTQMDGKCKDALKVNENSKGSHLKE